MLREKAQGFAGQQLERGAGTGSCGARERKRGEEGGSSVGYFAPLSQQNVTGASHFGCIFSKSEYVRKTGTFSEAG